MKTSAVLASILFGSYAVAAPVDRRALVYKTEIVTETVVVYTTVWDDEPVALPTTSAGEFYEKPTKPSTTSTAVVAPTSSVVPSPPAAPSKAAPTTSEAAPAYTPVVPEEPSIVSTPVPTTPAPAPEPTYEAPAPKPEPTTTAVTSAAPEPVYSQAPAPPPAPSSPASSYPTTGGTSPGVSFSNVEITVYDNPGAAGACGKPLTDDMKVVAISQGAWDEMGGTTHDYMTGESTNPWCGKNIEIQYNGKTARAQIMDLCPGCKHSHDIDLSRAVWKDLDLTETTRYNGVDWKLV